MTKARAIPRLLPRTFVCLVATVGLAAAPAYQPTEEGTGIIYGPDHAFMVNAPTGWVLDSKSGVEQGLYAVFYPTGSSWKDSAVVMYVNTATKKGDPTLKGLIEGDLQRQRRESPDIKMTPGKPIPTADGAAAPVNLFSGDRFGNHEAIAYIEAPTVWVMIVLSSRDENAYKDALPAFRSIVGSYRFMTTKVDIQDK